LTVQLNPGRPLEVASDDGARVYHLRVPVRADEAEWQEGLLGMGATSYSYTQLLKAMREAVVEHLQPVYGPEAEAMAADLDREVARLEEASERWRNQRTKEAEEALNALLNPSPRIEEIGEAVNRLNETLGPLRYNTMVSVNAAFPRRAGILALREFCHGWEGEGLPPFERGMKGVPHQLIAQVPRSDKILVGNRVAEHLRRDPVRLGNSPSPSAPSSSPSSIPGTNGQAQPIPSPTDTGSSTSSTFAS
jgi:hypothetical protein